MGGKNKNIFYLGAFFGVFVAILAVMIAAFWIGGSPAAAQVNLDPNLAATFGLGTADLVSTVIKVVQWALGLLGLVAVIMLLYGGFVWMTAAGSPDKVVKAKKIIIRAVIGLVIILLAWAIVTFIIERTLDFSGGSASCTIGSTTLCQECVDNGSGKGMWIYHPDWDNCSISPLEFNLKEFQTSHDGPEPQLEVHRCSAVKSVFNHKVDDSTVQSAAANGTLQVVLDPGGAETPVTGNWTTTSRSVTFKHLTNLLDAFADYQVRIPKTITNTSGDNLASCTAPFCVDNMTDNRYEWTFTTNDTVDDVPPEIVSAYPVIRTHANYPDRNVNRVPIISVKFSESIDDSTIIDGSGRPIVGNFTLEQLDGPNGAVVNTFDNNLLLVTQSGNGDGFDVYIEDPALNPLESFTWYRITVANIEDLCANAMNPAIDWEFQTNDKLPGVSAYYPKNDKACPDTTIGIVFNTSMYYQEVTFELTGGAAITMGPYVAADVGPPFQVTDANGNRWRVEDPNIAEPSKGFKHFQLIPGTALPTNSSFNVQVTTDLVKDKDGNILDQSWSFQTATAETCACEPVITQLQPDQGLNGECLTVRGHCFAGTTNHSAIPMITFDLPGTGPLNAPVEGADPNGTWLTSTVPNPPYADGDRPEVTVTIDYDDPEYDPPLTSNPVDFFINGTGEATGPCLYSLTPGEGYPNITAYTARGIRFDETSGTQEMHFQLATDKLSAITAWTENQILGIAPDVVNQFDYGQNDVWVVNDAGESNRLPFVIKPIPPDDSIVLSYGPVCSTACVNAVISGSISHDVEGRMDLTNTKLYSCNNTQCTDLTQVPIDHVVSAYIGGGDITLFQLVLSNPPGILDPNQRYRVVLVSGLNIPGGIINASGGVLSGLNYDDNLDGTRDSFSWTFATKDDASLCEIDHVDMTPATTTAQAGDDVFYSARAIGSPDQCSTAGQELDPAGFTWTWLVNDPLGRIPNRALLASTSNNTAFVTAQYRTDADPVFTEVTADDGAGHARDGSGELNIVDCETDQHCRNNCPGSNSVCDQATNHCTPAITSLSPDSGPDETIVTVNGCYFGSSQGDGGVDFGGTPASVVCGAAGWSNTRIIVQNPIDTSGSTPQVSVTTDSSIGSLTPQPGDTRGFTVTDLCLPGVPVPATGMPGICPPLDPTSGKEGDNVNFSGFNLFGNVPGTLAQFSDGGGGWLDSITGVGTGAEYRNATVPVNAQTGPTRVAVNDCPSNELNFSISCSNNLDCSTGCCKSSVCQDAAQCSSGTTGDLCQIIENPATANEPPDYKENPNCAIGPQVGAGDYDCISTTGDTSALAPPPPTPPAYGDDCRVCCDANPPQSSSSGLECYPDKGNCTGAERGLYCGCTTDLECGNPDIVGCGLGDPDACCYQRPIFEVADPADGSTINCTNQVINYIFETYGTRMDRSTINDTTVSVTDQNGNVIAGSIIANNYGFRFSPDSPYDTTTITSIIIDVDETQVANEFGVLVADPAANPLRRTWNLSASATLCSIDHIEYTVQTSTDMYTPPDLFTCALDTGCAGDISGNIGNQHLFTARAVDATGMEVTATYDNWSEDDPSDVFGLEDDGIPQSEFVRSNVNNGRGYALTTATEQFSGKSKTGRAKVNVMVCETPWPNPFAPDNDASPFEDSSAHPRVDTVDGAPNPPLIANFSTWYCRDNTSLPLLNKSDDVVVREFTPVTPGEDEMIKEYFFLRDGTADGIGIRIMENEDRRSPLQWYRNQFGAAAPAPQELEVDGYSAVRAGRTVYVSVMNLESGNLVPYIFLISYNEGASNDTIEIYNRLLKNWEFNLNMGPTEKEQMQRDLKRLEDLQEIFSKLLDYKEANTYFPKLAGGTFVQGMTNSAWPSWQDTLGSDLLAVVDRLTGKSFVYRLRSQLIPEAYAQSGLPIDPLNEFNLPDTTVPPLCDETAGFEQSTCWNADSRIFECPVGSHTYQYIVGPDGNTADLFANMEYLGPGSFVNYAGNPCAGANNCACFNYQFLASGNLNDHDGPNINSVSHATTGVPIVDGSLLNGTWPLVVDAADAGSGVDRVEFFVDGIRTYTDTDSASWNWDFDTSLYTDGDHLFGVTAYDKVGNRTKVEYDITIDNASGPDTADPFAIFISPADGETVSGTNVPVTVQGTDNRAINAIGIEVVGKPANITCPAGGATTFTCVLDWDLTVAGPDGLIYPNGDYELSATISDTAGNIYTATITVTVDNVDIVPPTVTIDHRAFIPPTSNYFDLNLGEEVSGTVYIWVWPDDDQGKEQFYKPGRVQFYLDGIYRVDGINDNADDVWEWQNWDTTEESNGLHQLTVIVYDDGGNYASQTRPININNESNDQEKPTVEFNHPPTPNHGDPVFDDISMSATAADNVGVVEVNFYRDYILRSTAKTQPYVWNLNVDNIAVGWHTFQVDAVDAAGNRSEPVEIRLNVGGGGAPICGDGIVSPFLGEECDDPDFGGQTCQSLGYECGQLECYQSGTPNECHFNTNQCINSTCPNGVIECGETCETGIPCPPSANACDVATCGASCSCNITRVCDGSAPGCGLYDDDYCAVCGHCSDGVQNCGETDIDSGGSCGTPGCTPGDEQCYTYASPPTQQRTQICNAAQTWIDENQTAPVETSPGSDTYNWDGVCEAMMSCFDTFNGCFSAGLPGAMKASCQAHGFQCTPACRTEAYKYPTWRTFYDNTCGCLIDADCDDGNDCITNTCDTSGPKGVCVDTPQAAGTQCEGGSGVCCGSGSNVSCLVPPGCTDDNDCDISTGQSCDNPSPGVACGMCVDQCTVPSDCSTLPCQVADCVGGSCTYSPQGDGTDCGGSNVCCGGSCGNSQCQSNADCGPGEKCDTPGPCTGNCLPAACGDADGVCPSGCDICQDVDCPASSCAAPDLCCGSPSSCTTPVCQNNGDCPGTQTCENAGTCNAVCVGECSGQPDNTSCSGGSGICCSQACTTAICNNDFDCSGSNQCVNPGRCDAHCETPSYSYKIVNHYDGEASSGNSFDPTIYLEGYGAANLSSNTIPAYAEVFNINAETEETYIYALPPTGMFQYFIGRYPTTSNNSASFESDVGEHTINIYDNNDVLIASFGGDSSYPLGCIKNEAFRDADQFDYWLAFRITSAGVISSCEIQINCSQPNCGNGIVVKTLPINPNSLYTCPDYSYPGGYCCPRVAPYGDAPECGTDGCNDDFQCEGPPQPDCAGDLCSVTDPCCYTAPYCHTGTGGSTSYTCRKTCGIDGVGCIGDKACCSGRCVGNICVPTCNNNGQCEVTAGETVANCPNDCSHSICASACATWHNADGICTTTLPPDTASMCYGWYDIPNQHAPCSRWPAGYDCRCNYLYPAEPPNDKCNI